MTTSLGLPPKDLSDEITLEWDTTLCHDVDPK